MVRKIKEKAKKALKKAEGKGGAAANGHGKGPEPPARLKQKLLKKAAFLEKLSASSASRGKPSSGGIQKQVKKKKRRPSVALGNLGSLADSLHEAAAKGAKDRKIPGSAVGTLKARERLSTEESARLIQVVQHPQFQADPLAALNSHLAATLPPPPEPPKPKMDARQKKAMKKMKKQKQKAEQEDPDMVE